MDYKKLSIGLALVVAFLAGCVVHDVVRVAPPARAGTNPQNWDYTCMVSDTQTRALERDLVEHGRNGWELAMSVGGPGQEHLSCFKRPLP
jgi:hypothetical protein